MFRCPVCRERSIAFWEKFGLTPFRSIICGHCGSTLRFHRLAQMVIILWPGVIILLGLYVIVAGMYAIELMGPIGGLLVLLGICSIHLILPLVPKDRALKEKTKDR